MSVFQELENKELAKENIILQEEFKKLIEQEELTKEENEVIITILILHQGFIF
jgi:hypothetical protein